MRVVSALLLLSTALPFVSVTHIAFSTLAAHGVPRLGLRKNSAATVKGCVGIRMQAPESQSENHLSRRTHVAQLAFMLGIAISGSDPAFAEKKKKSSGGLVGENPDAAQDLFTAKFQSGINKRTNRLFGCQTQTNCVSTAAGKNPTQFVAPWDFTTKTSDPRTVGPTLISTLFFRVPRIFARPCPRSAFMCTLSHEHASSSVCSEYPIALARSPLRAPLWEKSASI
jgi:hypothetical protein